MNRGNSFHRSRGALNLRLYFNRHGIGDALRQVQEVRDTSGGRMIDADPDQADPRQIGD